MVDGGWNFWGKTNGRLRQFTVADPTESEAISILKATLPDLEIVSRHRLDLSLIQFLGAKNGSVTEWVPANPRDRLERAGGVLIDQPMHR
jgi:hypothetical protein